MNSSIVFPRKGTHTPWGIADYVESRFPGVLEIGTPSHGGYWIAPTPEYTERLRAVASRYGKFRFNAQKRYYEEDCEAAIVVLAFPEAFPSGASELADRIATHFYSEPV